MNKDAKERRKRHLEEGPAKRGREQTSVTERMKKDNSEQERKGVEGSKNTCRKPST